MQHAADAAKPDDTIYVMAGRYDERIKVKAGGAEGKPVAFVAGAPIATIAAIIKLVSAADSTSLLL